MKNPSPQICILEVQPLGLLSGAHQAARQIQCCLAHAREEGKWLDFTFQQKLRDKQIKWQQLSNSRRQKNKKMEMAFFVLSSFAIIEKSLQGHSGQWKKTIGGPLGGPPQGLVGGLLQ